MATVVCVAWGFDARAAQAPNPRSGNTATLPSSITGGTPTASTSTTTSPRSGNTAAGRSAATASRTAVQPRVSVAKNVVSARTAPRSAAPSTSSVSRSAVRQKVASALSRIGRSATSTGASTSGVSRAAVSGAGARSALPMSSARSATTKSAHMSRAASTRATAVFDDVSKIGGGYAQCREAYNTCMDQFCAKANETYRRCYCSSRFLEFRDKESGLETAKEMLMQFQNNNLAAVGLTEGEANAMYTATVGEQAIKNDTSAAAAMLSEIGDLLSGKKKTESASSTSGSLGLIDTNFLSDIGDTWAGGGSSDSPFGRSSGRDLTTMEGAELYKAANDQCLQLVQASCDNDAALNMARSAYSILISQDCNTYEKKISTLTETVEQTVRQAEKILRDARLEEYRAHNSADVNQCLERVKDAITGDMVCGANYKKCLDNTGNYVDSNGEAIYTAKLFQLNKLINLYSNDVGTDTSGGDILEKNSGYNQFLDTKREFAASALDTCRDKADLVWTEFKRMAIIEIAQAQDALIEKVKSSCVSTMAECYDEQSGALKDMDTTTSQYSGAISAYAAKDMCQEKVAACAALYRDPTNGEECKFSNDGVLLNGDKCGMKSLRAFVDIVDSVKVQEGCKEALQNYLKTTCAATDGSKYPYPWGCRSETEHTMAELLWTHAKTYCKDPTSSKSITEDETVAAAIDEMVEQFGKDLYDIQETACEDSDGIWRDVLDAEEVASARETGLEPAYYFTANNGREPDISPREEKTIEVDGGTTRAGYNQHEYGYCLKNTVRYHCLAQDESTGSLGYATYDASKNMCNFTTEWYQIQCGRIGGYWENDTCYVK